jgi:hypothetical protein
MITQTPFWAIRTQTKKRQNNFTIQAVRYSSDRDSARFANFKSAVTKNSIGGNAFHTILLYLEKMFAFVFIFTSNVANNRVVHKPMEQIVHPQSIF